jgi:hypothetical protein
MAYYCTDCSYRGTTSGQVGECPACGSFKISKTQKGKKEKPQRKFQLAILVALWVYLIALIVWKLSS